MPMPALLLSLAALLWACAPVPARSTPPPSPIPSTTRQLVVVVTPSWSATGADLRRYERAGRGWQPVGEPVSAVVGRTGLGWGVGLHGPVARGPVKVEGDGRAPAGVFRLTAAFGYAESEPTGLPYVASSPDWQCVDDVASAYYNLVLDSAAVPDVDWESREQMRRNDALYRIGVIVGHNGPGLAETDAAGRPERRDRTTAPGRGSCIFLHVWRGPGSTTAGCTAMPDPALQGVLAWLDAAADPVLVQLPAEVYRQQAAAWGLPARR